jgi:xylan 1,4-beta-xylosidase
VRAIFWDYSPISLAPDSFDKGFYKNELPAKLAAPVTLTLIHLRSGFCRLAVYRTGYEQNDAYTAYRSTSSFPVRRRRPSKTLQAATRS